MNKPTSESNPQSCVGCIDQQPLGFDFSMAFQPIINLSDRNIFGYEALARGLQGESAYWVISQVNEDNRYRFDQLCRVKAIALAARLELPTMLSINFLPNAVYQPERCIQTTLEAAKIHGFPIDRIMFEFSEVEKIEDCSHIKGIVEYYQALGFKTAIDDFGSGHSGLGLLADLQTPIIKFDMALIRNIDADRNRQKIIRHCLNLFAELNIRPLAEGIETREEMQCLGDMGVELMQGYLFAKPAFEALPHVDFTYA